MALLIMLVTQALSSHELANRNIEKGHDNFQEYCSSHRGVNSEGQANLRSPNEDGKNMAPPCDETCHTWHHET